MWEDWCSAASRHFCVFAARAKSGVPQVARRSSNVSRVSCGLREERACRFSADMTARGARSSWLRRKTSGGLNLDVIRREHVRRIVLHVAGDDKIGATYNGSCHDMAVIGIGEADDMFQRLPAGH